MSGVKCSEGPRLAPRSWCLVVLLAACCGLVYWLDDCRAAVGYVRLPGALPPVLKRPLNPGFVVDTPGCRIPALDPLDPHVRRFVRKERPVDCAQGRPPPLVASNDTALLLDASLAPLYNCTEAELSCCYRAYWRGPDGDDNLVFSKNCTVFDEDVVVEDEFVTVECHAGGRRVYKDVHAFVRRKAAAAAAAAAAGEGVSVLVVGVDAVSRLNLLRQMPRTLALLRARGAVEMLGYNKVGDNTFPNVVPVLSGLSEAELRKACWPSDKDFFDDCPWIWRNFSAAGYRTAFGEDAPWMGIFTYVKKGFRRQPTDFYARTYQQVAEGELGHTKLWNAKLCVGAQLTLQAMLGYMSKFAAAMSRDPYFAFFWTTSLTHDFLNFPQLGDGHYEAFLRRHFEAGDLDRAVLVFTSDHGIRWGDIRETYQGRLEERLPFLVVVFPEWFSRRYGSAVANLRRNARRLTTPYDLHETLRDLLHLRELEDGRLRARRAVGRGRSLFLPGSDERTCEEAGVGAHWCTCQTSEPLNATDERVRRAAGVVLQHLNHLLRGHGECAALRLAEVRGAQRQRPTAELRRSHALADYVLVVRTSPGDALYEATVRRRSGDHAMAVEGVVSRINPYGEQSACVADYHIKLYCFCRSAA